MLKGIGIDLIEIERIKKASQNKNFLKRIFTEKEISYCLNKKNKYQHLAVRFAAKEAFKKAIDKNISFKEIEVIKENNKPKIEILNKKFKNKKIFLSLSHTQKYAVAVVIVF
jgi:holo-[acyl-carrier protein] synthase